MQTDVMQVCRNGHVVTDRLRSSPEHSRLHCDRCGAPTLCACPTCGSEICTTRIVPGLTFSGVHQPPEACSSCGAAFPWAGIKKETAVLPQKEQSLGLETLLRRLPLMVRQMRDRRPNRPRFRIEDHYDLEDLVRWTLPLVFDEVWPSARTPSYSPHTRTDFVLPKINAALTVKLTGPNLQRGEVEKELAEDVSAYADRSGLWFYIFDIERRFRNPDELERLWSDLQAKPMVHCVISG